jgi:hypothetical protein
MKGSIISYRLKQNGYSLQKTGNEKGVIAYGMINELQGAVSLIVMGEAEAAFPRFLPPN